jgi:hypothetical protein
MFSFLYTVGGNAESHSNLTHRVLRNARLFAEGSVPPVLHEGSNFFVSWPTFVMVSLFYDNHISSVKVKSHWGFDLPCPECWTHFHVFIGHLFIFFSEISIQTFCLSLIGLLIIVLLFN